MIEIKLDGYPISFPTSDKEVGKHLYKQIAAELLLIDSIENRASLATKIIFWVLPLRKRYLIRKKEIEGAALAEMCKYLGWAYQRWKIEPQTEIKPWIAYFKHKGQRYYLPEPDLGDVTVDEYSFLDMYVNRLSDAWQPEKALELLAVLARPKKDKAQLSSPDFNGYPRKEFNPELIKKNAEALKGAPDFAIYAAYDYAARAQAWLAKRYAQVFDSSEEKGGGNFGWPGLVMSIAEGGAFGTEQAVKRVNIHTICFFALKKTIEAREFKAELSKKSKSYD